MIEIRDRQNFAAGLLFAVLALAFLWFARDVPPGQPLGAGAADVPRLLAVGLLAIGGTVSGQALTWRQGAGAESMAIVGLAAGMAAASLLLLDPLAS